MTNPILLSATLALLLDGTIATAEAQNAAPHRDGLAVTAASGDATSGDRVATLRWLDLKASGELEVGEVVLTATDGEEEVMIVNETAHPLTVHLATVEPTGISKQRYAIRGRIRYENVEQFGYLEMWNHFADGSSYFSRTIASSGPMAKFHGTSSQREFVLPFQSEPHIGPPTRLEINLVLAARGKVWIGPLTVTEFSEKQWHSVMNASGAWWGNRTGGLIGAILGPLLGIIGGLVGTLCAWGRGKTFCIAICWFAICIGVACLLTGIAALFASQPYAVYYPLLMIGIIATVVMGCVLPTIRKRFADRELRKIDAMDAVAT